MKLSIPASGWVSLSIPESEDLTPTQIHAFEALTRMPGVRVWQEVGVGVRAELPFNVTTTREWRAVTAHDAALMRLDEQSAWIEKSAPPLWDPRRALYGHQVDAALFLVRHGGGLLADAMGLGKTAAAIVAAETLAGRAPRRPRVIIAPKYTRAVWLRELLQLGAVDSEADFEFGHGRDAWNHNFNYGAKYWFVHYDVAYAWINRLSISPLGDRGRPFVAILDEAHWARNPKTQRAKGAAAVAGLAPHRIALTGTPLANRPSDLWNVLTIVNGPRSWGGRHDFRLRYAGAYSTEHGYVDGEPSRTDELRARLERVYIRRTVEDSGVKLPAMRRQTLMTQFSEDEITQHNAFVEKIGGARELARAVIERRAGRATLAAITALRKLTSLAKRKATLDYVSDAVSSGDSVVVFCWQRETVAAMQKALTAAKLFPGAWISPIFAVTGADAQHDRDDIVSVFQEKGGVLLATLDSLKEGVTLTRASHVVIHDISWVPIEILQAEARIHRIGQTRPCTSVWALAADSIDLLLARVVREKAKTMHDVLGIAAADDAVNELELPAFLNETDEGFSRLFAELGIEVP